MQPHIKQLMCSCVKHRLCWVIPAQDPPPMGLCVSAGQAHVPCPPSRHHVIPCINPHQSHAHATAIPWQQGVPARLLQNDAGSCAAALLAWQAWHSRGQGHCSGWHKSRGVLSGFTQLAGDRLQGLLVALHIGLCILQGLLLGLGLCISILKVPANAECDQVQ